MSPASQECWGSQARPARRKGPGPGGTEQCSCSPWVQSPVLSSLHGLYDKAVEIIAIPAF